MTASANGPGAAGDATGPIVDVAAIADATGRIRARIADACRRAGRSPERVRLVAVTKTVPVEVVRAALEAGVGDFGENHATELARKAESVPATWHFIGRLQSGTVRHVADDASVVHSAEPGRALESLGRRASSRGRVIDCLAQVDFTGARQGVDEEHVLEFADRLAGVQGLRLAGLMTLPPMTEDPQAARPFFARLRSLSEDLRERHPEAGELSMGMSADFEVAVEEGATMVRVGTALFGPRPL